MEPIRIPRVQYASLADVYYIDGDTQIIESDQIVPGSQIYDSAQIIDSAMVIDGNNVIQSVPIFDGSHLRNSDGTYIQGVTIYNGDQNTAAQNSLFDANAIGATGVIDIESASMGIGSNQPSSLNSSPYRQGSGLNYSSSNNISNNIESTDGDYKIMTLTGGGGGYTNYRNNSLDDEDSDMKLKLNAPPEIAAVDNFVMQNMPDMENLDTLNFEFDLNAMDAIDSEGNFPGLDLGNVTNLSNVTPRESYNVNSSMVQQQTNSTPTAVPRITIRTKRTRKPRNNMTQDEPASTNLSNISYPPLEMLGISTPSTVQASNDIEYNTPIPHVSPMFKEESQSSSYSSPVSPCPSTSSSYGSPHSPSSGSQSTKPRASLASMTDAERYRHIRNQNNESSRIYRQKKKMSIKEAEAELLVLQERNTRLKEVFDAIKQKKELAHTLMKGFVQDASRQRKQ